MTAPSTWLDPDIFTEIIRDAADPSRDAAARCSLAVARDLATDPLICDLLTTLIDMGRTRYDCACGSEEAAWALRDLANEMAREADLVLGDRE